MPREQLLADARVRAREYQERYPERIKAQQQTATYKARNSANSSRNYEKLRDYLHSLKSQSGGCIDCGYTADVTALHFHHRPGETKFKEVGRMNGYSKARVDAEIAKCDILCKTCHEARHTPNRIGAPRGSA